MIELALFLAPIVLAGVFIAIDWSTYNFSAIKADAILGAIWYPFVGGLAGGLIGLGVSRAPEGGHWSLLTAFLAVWIFGGLGGSWYYKALRNDARPSRVSAQVYYQDISYLAELPTVTVLSGHEYGRWQTRARELRSHGRRLGEDASKGRNFRSCWTSLKRITRAVIVVEVALVIVFAVTSSILIDEPRLLLGILSGISVPCAVWLWLLWCKHLLLVKGLEAERAAEQILELLQQFEVEAPELPPAKLGQRLARLLSIRPR
ncbi:hypothetical protein [Spirillospora sp. NPDC048819]|uniref:hypothetical protein n=1 Tax=Spirillospora sp. NPDC048819 TaxID=3155268 RepID=UPI0033D5AF17